jgi:hypothetical protein
LIAVLHGCGRITGRRFELSPIFGDGLTGQAAANLA